MNEYTSRILRIGIVNSGMFELLDLNMDVKAIHFIAENNVGKTSLIELIQFLYFHDLRDITFSKSHAESMPFYFRREGSYILFEVRTVARTKRTVGIYGKGTRDSRKIFVFDGSFDLDDFLDDRRCVFPLAQVKQKFFGRDFHIFPQLKHYEKALLGQHPTAHHNVQMFDLSVSNFRLLRKLLQGLLRLDRLTAKETQQFLIEIVETSTVKTKINIAHDFERKNRGIHRMRQHLDTLRQLAPIITTWQTLEQQIDIITRELEAHSERLYHVSCCYLAHLEDQLTRCQTDYEIRERELETNETRKNTFIEKRTESKTRLDELTRTIKQFEALQTFCDQHSQFHAEQTRNTLIHQKIDLEKLFATIQVEDLRKLRRQLRQRHKKQEQLQSQMQNRTFEQVWIEAQFPAEHRALLKFLLSEELLSFSVESIVSDHDEVLRISRKVTNYLDQDGTFTGFGVTIPKATWYMPEEESESIEERLETIQHEIHELERKIEAAEHREKKEQELREIEQRIQQQDEVLRKFDQLQRFENEYGSLSKCRERHEQVQTEYSRLSEELHRTESRIAALRAQSQQLYVCLEGIKGQIQDTRRTHQALKAYMTECPEEILALPERDLAEEYRLGQRRIEDRRRELKLLEKELSEPQSALEERYDREAPEISFEQWVQNKLNITHEIGRVEEQLRESYQNLITEVSKELSNLLQSFETVQNKVADLNDRIRKVSISNIERIEVTVKKSDLVDAIRQTGQIQEDLFSRAREQTFSFEEAQTFVEEYLVGKLQVKYGGEIHLRDMFRLEFVVKFFHSEKPMTTSEIHKFESHGTETGIKIVLYLGLIKLLQERRKSLGARIPFFLDEVGSIDSNNLKQLITYCAAHNFLPIFASPDIRPDIPYNYIFKRNGDRSYLENVVIITDKEE